MKREFCLLLALPLSGCTTPPNPFCQVQHVKSLYFQSLMRQEVAWHDAHAPGDLTQRLQQLSNDLHAGMGNKLGLAVSGSVAHSAV
jgi:hypothetical protein